MEQVDPVMEAGWKHALRDEFNKEYFRELKLFLLGEKKKYRIFPPGKLIFNAFNQTPFDRVKVVLLGQDPYHGAGQAHGLCFSVPESIQKPPSLINILKELKSDLGYDEPKHGDLTSWAAQGVLLLNATLTVRQNQAGSHQNHGWETFTDAAIKQLSLERMGLVFILWGNYAMAKRSLIDTSRHFILTSVHPSPLSAHRGFFGCRHFSQVNNFLRQQGTDEINWKLP
ncbi:MAG: uracil-DNA glycosylase [Bacteroidales bacterium]|nr:uracil-DNA glycosylase [Bacteroidales bacterium]